MPTAYKLTIKKFIEFIHTHTHIQIHIHPYTYISRQQKRPLGDRRFQVLRLSPAPDNAKGKINLN